jgi:hypothetical protein
MPNPQTTQKLKQLMVKYQANIDKYRIAFKKNDGKIDAIEASALDQLEDMIRKINNELVLRGAGSSERVVEISKDLQELRQETRRALDAYVETLEAEARAVADWLLANWLEFFLRTTSQPGISASHDLIKKTIGGALSAGTNEALKALGKKAAQGLTKSLVKGGIIAGATVLGGTIGNVPGAVVGFIVGVIVDVCVNLVWDMVTPNGEMLAVMRTNEAVLNYFKGVQNKLIAKREEQIKKINDFASNSRDAIDIHENTEELLEAISAMRSVTGSIDSPTTSDITLKNALLQIWVKENAGDDSDDPNKYGAADEQWERAVEHLQEEEVLPKGDGITHQSDVFVHQLRAEMNRFGLNTNNQAYKKLVKKVDTIKQVANASTVFQQFNNYELIFTENDVVDAEHFIQQCNYTYDGGGLSTGGETVIRNKKPLTFKIKVLLTKDENSVFVDSFDYYIHLNDEDIEFYASAKASWSEDID